MTGEPRTHEWCRVCREVQKFGTLDGFGAAPSFRICSECGSGYSIDRETA